MCGCELFVVVCVCENCERVNVSCECVRVVESECAGMSFLWLLMCV
jgi:hypothetical protein